MTGVAVDPITMLPIDEYAAGPAMRKRLQAEKDRLGAQAALAGITETQAARRIKAMATALLYDRINTILCDDPEAKAYLKMLRALGETSDIARQAALRLAGN